MAKRHEEMARAWLDERNLHPYGPRVESLAALLARVEREAIERALGECVQVAESFRGGRKTSQMDDEDRRGEEVAETCWNAIRALLTEEG